MNKELIIIAGPTASGKTDLSVQTAKGLSTEIISADSRQIYREMTIGTAVPDKKQLDDVKHHFIHHISISDYYNASMYENEVISLLTELFREHDKVVMTGGSGLYIDAVRFGIDDLPPVDKELRENIQKKLDEEGIESLRKDLKFLDPESYARIDLRNPKRIQKAIEISIITGKPYSSFLTSPRKERNFKTRMFVLDRKREDLYERINQRVLDMMERGLEEEARSLYSLRHFNALNTVGYKELFDHFEGEITMKEAIRRIQANTRKYARKQLTWFRKNPEAEWIAPDEIKNLADLIIN